MCASAGNHRAHVGGHQEVAVYPEVVLELLAEVGYDRLTMDAVAARARASKPTIYRRWPGKAELVADALNSVKGAPKLPDTGSLREIYAPWPSRSPARTAGVVRK